MLLNSLSESTMSMLEVKLNKSLSDDWQIARAVFEENHKVFSKVVHLKRIRTSTEDEFEAHLLDVHRRCCEACPSPGGCRRGVQPDRDAADRARGSGAADNPHERKIFVSTSTQTTCGYGMNGLQIDALDMLDDSVVNDKDKDIHQTSILLSTTCHGGDYEAQADVNGSPEKSSNKRGIKQEDHDNESTGEKEKDTEQREDDAMDDLLEEGRPSSLEDQMLDNHELLHAADVTSYMYLERTNQVFGLTIKDERGFQDHGDVDMDSSANESTSHQKLIKEELPSDGSDVQSHWERTNQASDHPIRHERDSEDVDMESSRNEATYHQRLEEENGSQDIISCVQSPAERTNRASDLLIKQRDPQDGCMDSSKNEATSLQRLEEEIPTDGSDGKAILESNSEPSDPTCNLDGHNHEGQSSKQSHADGKTIQEDTNMPSCPTNNCDVHILDDNCQDLFHALTDSYKKDQNTTESGGKKPFQCPSCNKRYSYKNAFHTHLRTHSKPKHYQEGKHPTSSEGNKTFHCSDCHKIYSCLNEYYKHLSTHTFQKPYQCSIYGQKCTQKDHINRHMMIHSEEKLFKCDCCSNSCSQKGRFKIHMRTCTGEKPFKCDYCSYSCSQKGNLCHIRTHTAENPFKCDFCSYRCHQKSNLQVHMRTHAGEKIYKCDYCSYRSDKKVNLQGHMRTHTREKPFKCENCSYSCSKKENLQVHIRTHTAEKPFKCDYCSYRCCQKSHLKVHMRTHTGDKPHQCSLCGKRFCQTGQLKRHMKTHTGAKPL